MLYNGRVSIEQESKCRGEGNLRREVMCNIYFFKIPSKFIF